MTSNGVLPLMFLSPLRGIGAAWGQQVVVRAASALLLSRLMNGEIAV